MRTAGTLHPATQKAVAAEFEVTVPRLMLIFSVQFTSFFFTASEGYWRGTSSAIRRYTTRIDGFVSFHAPLSGASFTTKPLTFTGNRLSLNISTSAAGYARCALTLPDNTPVPGYDFADCSPIIGDTLDYNVTWQGGSLSTLNGQALRLHVQLHDGDLYAFQFCE